MLAFCGGQSVVADEVENRLLVVGPRGTILRESHLNGTPSNVGFAPNLAFEAQTGTVWAALYAVPMVVRMDADGIVSYVAVPDFARSMAAGNGRVYALLNGKVSVIDAASATVVQTVSFSADVGHSHTADVAVTYDAIHDQLFTYAFLDPSDVTRGVVQDGKLQVLETVRSTCENAQAMAVSPDGLHFSISCGGGDSPNGYFTIDRDPLHLTATSGSYVVQAYPRGAAFSPDSRYYVTTNAQAVLVYDVTTHLQVASWPSPCNVISGKTVSFSRGGHNIVVACTDAGATDYGPRVQVFAFHPTAPPAAKPAGFAAALDADCAMETPAPSSSAVPFAHLSSAVLLCDGNSILGDGSSNQLSLVRSDGTILASAQLSGKPWRLALDAKNHSVWALVTDATRVDRLSADGTVSSIELDLPATIAGLELDSTPTAIAAADGQVFVRTFGYLVQIDGATGAIVATLPLPGSELGLLYDPTHQELFTAMLGHDPTEVKSFQLSGGALTLLGSDSHCSYGNALAASGDGLHFSIACSGGDMLNTGYVTDDRDPASLSTVNGTYAVGPAPFGSAFSPDGKRYATANADHVLLFDTATHALVQSWPAPCNGPLVTDLGFSPGGKNLAVYCAESWANTATPVFQVFAVR